MRRDVLTDAGPRFIDAARAYVGFAFDRPDHYAVMFDQIAVRRPLTRCGRNRRRCRTRRGCRHAVGSLRQARPCGSRMAAWPVVHGFSLLRRRDAVNAETAGGDPIAAVQHQRADSAHG
jgi:hypothetical protein